MLDFVISGLSPFAIVEKSNITRHIKCDDVSVKNLKKYMSLITARVENRISKLLPEKIALAFDGWSAGSDYYVAVFATHFAECEKGYESKLLTFSALDDPTTQNSDNHLKFFDFVLETFGK